MSPQPHRVFGGAMKARLVMQLRAPSSHIALTIVRAALDEFLDQYPGALLSKDSGQPAWDERKNVLTMALVAQCNSESDAMSFNKELVELIAKQQRANGIIPDSMIVPFQIVG
jgi:hypothetical protein